MNYSNPNESGQANASNIQSQSYQYSNAPQQTLYPQEPSTSESSHCPPCYYQPGRTSQAPTGTHDSSSAINNTSSPLSLQPGIQSTMSILASSALSKRLSSSNIAGNQLHTYGKDGTHHSYSSDERRSFTEFVNSYFKNDPDMMDVLPISTENDDLFKVVSQGLLLPKIIMAFQPHINLHGVIKKDLNNFQLTANHAETIRVANEMGCDLINIGPEDLINGTPHLVLGFIWQLLKRVLLDKVTVKRHPELLTMLRTQDDIDQFIKQEPEQNLITWVNYHLENAAKTRRISNFSQDIQDGECYLNLLSQITPHDIYYSIVGSLHPEFLPISDRVELVCQIAHQIGALQFVTPKDILDGNPILNLAFVAYLFHQFPSLDYSEEQKRIEIIAKQNSEQEKMTKDDLLVAKVIAERESRFAGTNFSNIPNSSGSQDNSGVLYSQGFKSDQNVNYQCHGQSEAQTYQNSSDIQDSRARYAVYNPPPQSSPIRVYSPSPITNTNQEEATMPKDQVNQTSEYGQSDSYSTYAYDNQSRTQPNVNFSSQVQDSSYQQQPSSNVYSENSYGFSNQNASMYTNQSQRQPSIPPASGWNGQMSDTQLPPSYQNFGYQSSNGMQANNQDDRNMTINQGQELSNYSAMLGTNHNQEAFYPSASQSQAIQHTNYYQQPAMRMNNAQIANYPNGVPYTQMTREQQRSTVQCVGSMNQTQFTANPVPTVQQQEVYMNYGQRLPSVQYPMQPQLPPRDASSHVQSYMIQQEQSYAQVLAQPAMPMPIFRNSTTLAPADVIVTTTKTHTTYM